jgi:hypothetical protein
MKTINEMHNLFIELFTQVYGYNPKPLNTWDSWTIRDYKEEIDFLYDEIERRNMAVLGGW